MHVHKSLSFTFFILHRPPHYNDDIGNTRIHNYLGGRPHQKIVTLALIPPPQLLWWGGYVLYAQYVQHAQRVQYVLYSMYSMNNMYNMYSTYNMYNMYVCKYWRMYVCT